MNGYVLGFVAVSAVMMVVMIAALIFISFDGNEEAQDTRIRFRNVRHVSTNTIETVNFSGEVEQWNRTA